MGANRLFQRLERQPNRIFLPFITQTLATFPELIWDERCAHLYSRIRNALPNNWELIDYSIQNLLLVNRNIKYLDIWGFLLGPEGAACIARALSIHSVF